MPAPSDFSCCHRGIANIVGGPLLPWRNSFKSLPIGYINLIIINISDNSSCTYCLLILPMNIHRRYFHGITVNRTSIMLYNYANSSSTGGRLSCSSWLVIAATRSWLNLLKNSKCAHVVLGLLGNLNIYPACTRFTWSWNSLSWDGTRGIKCCALVAIWEITYTSFVDLMMIILLWSRCNLFYFMINTFISI